MVSYIVIVTKFQPFHHNMGSIHYQGLMRLNGYIPLFHGTRVSNSSRRHFNWSVQHAERYSGEELMDKDDQEEIFEHLKDLKAYPSYSSILNPQHFYQNKVLMDYSEKQPHAVSLRQLAGFGKTLTKQKIINSANFVRLELPIRFAMRIRDLQTLPFGVVNNVHLARIYESYYDQFNAFRKTPTIRTLEENDAFCERLSTMLDEHVFNLSNLMMGALEVSNFSALPREELDVFMSSILRSRISRRVIIEEHLSLTENHKVSPYSSRPPDFIGEIFKTCNSAEHFRIVANSISESLLESHPSRQNMPVIEIDGDMNASLPFLIPHLHYLFGEILRNSIEATIKTHGGHSSKKLPPIKIYIADADREITFKISDQGGGITNEALKTIWSFKKTPSAAKKYLANFHSLPDFSVLRDPIGPSSAHPSGSGNFTKDHRDSVVNKKSTLEKLIRRPHAHKLGLGLPMCKVYSDYWNGDLSIDSVEGYGTDVCLRLTKLGYYSNLIQLDRA